MYNSREIGELRADVAVNCRTLIERAAARGLPVLVVLGAVPAARGSRERWPTRTPVRRSGSRAE